VRLQGRAGGTGSWVASITPTTLTASRTITIPNLDGTLALTGAAQAVSFGTLSSTALTSTGGVAVGGALSGATTGAFSSTVTTGRLTAAGTDAGSVPASQVTIGGGAVRAAGGITAGGAVTTGAGGELRLNQGATVFPSDATGILFQGFQGAGTPGTYTITVAGASTGTAALGSGISGEDFRRLRILVTGEILQGDGTAAATSCMQPSHSSTANDCRLLLYDVSAGTLKRVSRGGSDSGGTGFRVLRIPN
jgi:hypothetical protein